MLDLIIIPCYEAWTQIRDTVMTRYEHEDATNFEKLGHRYGMDTTHTHIYACMYVYICVSCVILYIDTHITYDAEI